jgi:hypothetical protein
MLEDLLYCNSMIDDTFFFYLYLSYDYCISPPYSLSDSFTGHCVPSRPAAVPGHAACWPSPTVGRPGSAAVLRHTAPRPGPTTDWPGPAAVLGHAARPGPTTGWPDPAALAGRAAPAGQRQPAAEDLSGHGGAGLAILHRQPLVLHGKFDNNKLMLLFGERLGSCLWMWL